MRGIVGSNFSKYLFTLHAVRFKKTTTVEFTNEELDQVELEVQGRLRRSRRRSAPITGPLRQGHRATSARWRVR